MIKARALKILFAVVALGVIAGCSGADIGPAVMNDEMALHEAAAAKEWGVEVEGIRLTAAGHMLDFRFRVIDPDKAAPLVERKNRAYLIDQLTGVELEVPSMPRVGMLRQTVSHGKPRSGSTFFIMFANTGGLVKKGGKVTVAINEFRAEGLTVE